MLCARCCHALLTALLSMLFEAPPARAGAGCLEVARAAVAVGRAEAGVPERGATPEVRARRHEFAARAAGLLEACRARTASPVIATNRGGAPSQSSTLVRRQQRTISRVLRTPPVKVGRVTSATGIRRDPITGLVSRHRGIDIAAPLGTEIHVPADGLVTTVGFDRRRGNFVIIDHGDSITATYLHLADATARPQQLLRAGDIVGHVGATGRTTGPHLHYEVRLNGMPLDIAGF